MTASTPCRQADGTEAHQGARRDLDELGLVPGRSCVILSSRRSAPGRGARDGAQPPAAARRPRCRGLGHREALAGSVAGDRRRADRRRDRVPRTRAARRAPRHCRRRSRAGVAAGTADSLVEIDPATNCVCSGCHVGKGRMDIAAFTVKNAAWVVTSDRTVDRVDLRTRQARAIVASPSLVLSPRHSATTSGSQASDPLPGDEPYKLRAIRSFMISLVPA